VAGEERVRQARWRRSTTTSPHLERVSKSSVSLRDGDSRQCSIVDGGRDRVNWGCDAHRGSQRKSGYAIAVCVAEACRKSLIHFSSPRIDFCKQKLAREMLDWRGFFARANNFRFRLKKAVLFSPTPTCSTACCRVARSQSPCLCKGDR
jgi:hypothetical protein